MVSAAYDQLKALTGFYGAIAPKWAFPAIPFLIAAIFQVVAWFGGRYLQGYTLLPRVLILWIFALGEYSVMSPAMNAAQEVLGMQENTLIIMYNVATLFVFMVISVCVFKNTFGWRHIVAFGLLLCSVFLVYS
jgi:uncharacterized protein (DUF486 family)